MGAPNGPEGSDEARSDFERVGGEAGLRALVDDFVGRMFDDVMIGFLFAGRSRDRLREYEFRLAAEQLGGPWRYDGRGIGEVHRALPILGGHFARRRRILENTLRDRAVPDDVATRWLAHVDALRDAVLGAGITSDDCDHAAQAARLHDDEVR